MALMDTPPSMMPKLKENLAVGRGRFSAKMVIIRERAWTGLPTP